MSISPTAHAPHSKRSCGSNESTSRPAANLLQKLGRFVEGIHATRDMQELHRVFARSIRNFVSLDRVSIAQWNQSDPDHINVRAYSGEDVFPEGIQLPFQGTAVGHAITLREPFQLRADEPNPFLESKPLAAEGLRAIMSVPLVSGDMIYGTLNLARSHRPYNEDEVAVIVQIASHITASIVRREMLAQIRTESAEHQEQARRMMSLAVFSQELSSVESRQTLFTVLAKQLRYLFNCPRASIVMLEPEHKSLRLVALSGNPDGLTPVGKCSPLEGTSIKESLSRSGPSFWSDLGQSPYPTHKKLAKAGLQSSISIPLVIGNCAQGCITISFAAQVEPTESLRAMLRAVANVTEATLDRLRAEKALRSAQKLESLGLLAGGLAHDFNNLLGAALGHLSVVEELLPSDSLLQEDIGQVHLALERSSKLTQQMLAYVGQGAIKTEQIDLNQTLREIGGLFAASSPKKIDLSFALASHELLVDANATQLQQVVVNLLTNAIDAIDQEYGSVRLETSHLHLQKAEPSMLIPGHTVLAGHYARMVCKDTGCGMSQEVLSRVFEPYFTTKVSGHGLGLAAVLGIVREHGGELRARSEPGHGTTFELLLPQKMLSATAERRAYGRKLALVVDDESIMRRAACRMLNVLGYETLEAQDGLDGLKLFHQQAHRLNLVLIDQSMPRMSGTDAILKMRELAPKRINIVLMTGFDKEDSLHFLSDDHVLGILQKPFRLSHLREFLTPKAVGSAT